MAERIAAIDCGTNSVRLLVAEPSESASARLRTLDRRMRITRLGQGVGASGRLATDAVERALAVLREYRGVLDELGVRRVRFAATSAARDAANRDDFFVPAAEVVGVRPELLSGTEEAELSFAGATAELDGADGPFLVVDIGGGSTEFVLGTDHVDAVMSVDVGCVRITEAFLAGDPPAPEELSAALSVIDVHLDDVLCAMPEAPAAATLVGLAGTVSTAAAVELGLPAYDRSRIHHFELTKAAAEDVFRTLATEAFADRVHNPGLERERADVIVGGMCVLVSILRRFGFERCLVSESDILDGLALSMLDGTTSPGTAEGRAG